MPEQRAKSGEKAGATVHVVADELIAVAAELSAWCFRLNGHGGLVFEEQADFYQKGEIGQFLVERLREQYVRILEIGKDPAKRAALEALTSRVQQASNALASLYKVARPKDSNIHAAAIGTAGALDLLDDLSDSIRAE